MSSQAQAAPITWLWAEVHSAQDRLRSLIFLHTHAEARGNLASEHAASARAALAPTDEAVLRLTAHEDEAMMHAAEMYARMRLAEMRCHNTVAAWRAAVDALEKEQSSAGTSLDGVAAAGSAAV